MNSIKKIILSVLFLSTVFVSCSDDDGPINPVVEYDRVAYIVNYGGYGKSNGEISTYDIEKETINQDSYKVANAVDFTSNIESISIHEDVVYLMSNAGDKIDILDAKTLKAIDNPISEDITKPRHFVAEGNMAYISCWGNVDDWNVVANSYIAKIDLTTREITKIALPGAPEGLIIVNNKLYTGLCTTNKVAVIDLSTDAISFIEVPAVPQQFVIDHNGTIWVSLVSKYSTPFTEDKLGVAAINPATDEVVSEVNFPKMGSNGFIHISSNKETIYALGAEAWPGTTTSIYTIDVDAKVLSSDAVLSGENFNGFNLNPENNDIYLLIRPNSKEAGTLKVYTSNAVLLSEKETGISPKHVVFYAIEK